MSSAEQQRDQEMRKFCELMRLIWVEESQRPFSEMLTGWYYQIGGTDGPEPNDKIAYSLLQKMYHDGPHDGLEADFDTDLDTDTGVEIGELTPG